MEPTLPAGALLAVKAVPGGLTAGMVVVVKRPEGREDVKRIAAGPGERITLADGTGITLGSDEYAVEGDNQVASTDSRQYGAVGREEIVAVARFCYWPPRAWKVFRRR